MSHPAAEIASAVVLTIAAAVAGVVAITPRHKPEPPPMQQAEQVPPIESVRVPLKPIIVIEADKPKTDAERIDKLEKDVGAIADEQRNLSQTIKELTEREKAK